MLRRFHPLLIVLLLAGVVASLITLVQRYRTEARNRGVALVLDYNQFRTLVAAAGVPQDQAFHDLKAAGITGVAVTEETLSDLLGSGIAQVTTSAGANGREYAVRIADPAVKARAAEYISRFSRAATERPPTGDHVLLEGPGGAPIYIPGRIDDVRLTPTGLDEAAVQQCVRAGLEPVGRINNPLGLTADSLTWDLTRVRRLGIRTVVFAGEEVLGFKGLIPQTADAIRGLGMLYGSVEMGKQRGDEELSRLLEERLVRVHSISSAEMPRLTPKEAIERYVRAAAERNIRLDYVRLPGIVGANTYADSVAYVRSLSETLDRAKFGLVKQGVGAQPFEHVWSNVWVGRLLSGFIGLGAGAGLALLIAGMLPLPRGRQAVVGGVLAVLCGVLAFTGSPKALQVVTLVVAVVFPTLGFILFPQPIGAFAEVARGGARHPRAALSGALVEFACISIVTLCGGFMIGALLAKLPFMIKTESFAGIKAATVLPLALVGMFYLTGMSPRYGTWSEERREIGERLRAFFSEPLRVWQVVAFAVAIAAVALLVARSGNDPGVGVSDTELKFRALLDRFLGARPRTKEFLVGHPALLISLFLASFPRWRGWAFPVLLVGTIGQTGMLNSYCHLHTPLKMTLLHTFHALWMGLLLGVALIWLWLRVFAWDEPVPLRRKQ